MTANDGMLLLLVLRIVLISHFEQNCWSGGLRVAVSCSCKLQHTARYSAADCHQSSKAHSSVTMAPLDLFLHKRCNMC